MIVKILYNKSTSFPGISYNTNKMEKDKGELVKVSGFGALQGLDHMRPSDYTNYLEAISARSKRIQRPQFHAMISCKGKSHTKEQLSDIAEQWLKGMGYGEQPYLLVFHKDTKNNHLHIVTTRVNREGKKIDDSFEKLKAYQVLNRVIGADEHLAVHPDIEKALAYRFSTRPQFMMILEAQGYKLLLSSDEYKVIKFGKELASLQLAKVDERIASHQKDKSRISQLRAIIEDKRLKHDPSLQPLTRPLPGGGTETVRSGYTSALAEMLREKLGVHVIFHAKDDKQPYGYTFLDHHTKQVFKGKEVMDLKDFIAPVAQSTLLPPERTVADDARISSDSNAAETTTSPEVRQSLAFEPYEHQSARTAGGFQIDLAGDIDDEAINGRNRRRKRKARTNTR